MKQKPKRLVFILSGYMATSAVKSLTCNHHRRWHVCTAKLQQPTARVSHCLLSCFRTMTVQCVFCSAFIYVSQRARFVCPAPCINLNAPCKDCQRLGQVNPKNKMFVEIECTKPQTWRNCNVTGFMTETSYLEMPTTSS